MTITINGQSEDITEGSISVVDLLKLKEVEMPDMVSVQINGTMLKRAEFVSTPIREGDEIDFLYFMGGGKLL
jgi:sulfur carrier protein